MLSDFDFKTFYSTASDNIPANFYNLAMREACCYDRVSGYFSSNSLVYYSEGIENLINNKGKYRLIISHEISESDYNEIVNGYKKRTERIGKQLINKLDFDKLDNYHKQKLSNLGYLIEIGLVDIKIGFIHSGLFHAKFGLFRDSFENIVYFSGSLNETEAGLKKNYEEITVLKSWENTTSELQGKVNYFNKLWNNRISNGVIFVRDINDVVKNKLVTFSQGKIIVDKSVFVDKALILFYDEKLHLQNNLGKPLDLKQRTLKKLIKKGYIDETASVFSSKLSYIEIQEIVKLFYRYSDRTNSRLIVSDSVNNFISNSEFKIQEVAKRGTAIKNKDEIFLPNYRIFNEIILQEVSRPLYEIQSWVSFYQAMMKKVANFSVPGAGKTSMIYGTYAYLSSKQINLVDQIIVIGPKNSFISWKEEFKAVFKDKRKLKVLDVHASDFSPNMFYKNVASYNLILINYESLVKYREALLNMINTKTMLVFDEVHKIKRAESERARIAIELSKKTIFRYVLTGTPIPNSYQDIWNFLHILFDSEFKKYFGFNISSLKNPDRISVEDINDKINPFFWRVTKSELNVPKENEDNLILTSASEVEQELINSLWKNYAHSPFKLYIRLIQLASNPALLKNEISIEMYAGYNQETESDEMELIDDKLELSTNELKLINSIENSTKYVKCLEMANKLILENRIIVIWCIFIETINKLKRDLIQLGHKVAIIYGAIDTKEREKVILDFQNGHYDVLITNPHTLAESVSLHMIAHDALYLEFSFNLTHMLQSRDRIHRIGLKEDQETNYYYFMLEGHPNSRNTIDKKIYNRLNEKREIMYEAIESTIIKPEFSINERDEILQMMQDEINK